MSEVKSNRAWREECESLRQQLASLKAELKAIGKAINDPRTDLTMTMSEVIIEFKQQLAAALAACKLKDEALEAANNGLRYWMDAFPLSVTEADNEEMLKLEEALAATDDLSGLVLCDAEPVAWMFDGLTGTYFGKEDKLPRPEAIQRCRRKKP